MYGRVTVKTSEANANKTKNYLEASLSFALSVRSFLLSSRCFRHLTGLPYFRSIHKPVFGTPFRSPLQLSFRMR